jgi:hypothetical protein
VAVGRVDHDGAGSLRAVVGDFTPEKLRIDGRDVGGREREFLVRLRSVHGDVGRMWRLEVGVLRRLRRDAACQGQGQKRDADQRKMHGRVLTREKTETGHGAVRFLKGDEGMASARPHVPVAPHGSVTVRERGCAQPERVPTGERQGFSR